MLEPWIYLATPYRSHPGGREDAAEEAASAAAPFIRAQIPTFCPIPHSHAIAALGGLNPDGDLWPRVNAPFLEGASAFVIVTLAGWKESEGIRAERKIAQDCGISCWSTEMGQIPNGLSEYLGGLNRKAEWHDAATDFKRRAEWAIVSDSEFPCPHCGDEHMISATTNRIVDPSTPSIPDPKTAREFCEKAASLVDGPRHHLYGDRHANIGHIGRLWSAYLGHEISAVDVCHMMTQLKQSRYKNGQPHADVWVDGCGYMSLAGEIAATSK